MLEPSSCVTVMVPGVYHSTHVHDYDTVHQPAPGSHAAPTCTPPAVAKPLALDAAASVAAGSPAVSMTAAANSVKPSKTTPGADQREAADVPNRGSVGQRFFARWDKNTKLMWAALHNEGPIKLRELPTSWDAGIAR
jgi:hypothetical protein